MARLMEFLFEGSPFEIFAWKHKSLNVETFRLCTDVLTDTVDHWPSFSD